MESLFAYSFLWSWGFCSEQEYHISLNRLFLENPDSELLLELEKYSDDVKKTFARLKRYFEYETVLFDSAQFGQTLFTGLEAAYQSGDYDIAEFGRKCYELWKLLPGFLCKEQPFWVLSYADEPLSWGDEDQSRALYEEAFQFYKR